MKCLSCDAIVVTGRQLFTMIDPLDTTDASHLLYQQRNRDRVLPTGLIRIRISYEGQIDEWPSLARATLRHERLRTAKDSTARTTRFD
jgi:hypothetical protein